jgi:tRNA G37 N-methylase Trm5
MSRFCFDVGDGDRTLHIQGDVAIVNSADAQEHAERLAHGLVRSNPRLRQLTVRVWDEVGREVYRVALIAGRAIH